MRIHFYSPVSFEPWDWRNSVELGIGGSETSHVEMAWRLARRGHEVITYAPIPEDCPGEWRNTTWKPLKDADFSEPGLWILYRCPSTVDEFLLRSPITHPVWLMFQDWSYPDLTAARIARCQRLITLCHAHGRDLNRQYPTGAEKLWITSNGLKADLLAEVEAETDRPQRDPHKIMFASSPDRGLLHVLRSVQRAREYVPTLSVHAFYGYNNLDKLIAAVPGTSQFAKDKAEVEKFATEPWVHLRGRVDQRTLYREWLSSGLWVYQTNFNETSCITCMEAQACGAIPIVNPVYALGENVRYGIGIEGDAWGDPLTKARFAAEIVRASSPIFQDRIRPQMMADARKRFDWENFVDQWDKAAAEDLHCNVGFTRETAARPLLSVVTPSIRLAGLEPVYDCLKAQTYTHWEWIIAVPAALYAETLEWILTLHDQRVGLVQEPHDPEAFYQLNKTWNALFRVANGQAIVSATDWLWFEEDALQRLAQRFMAEPETAISVPTSHVKSVSTLDELTWVDYRLLQARDCGERPVLAPSAVELNLALIPLGPLLAVGGMDESYDMVAGMSEKELAYRLQAAGVTFVLEKRLRARAIEHSKEWPDWDEKVKLARTKLDADATKIMSGLKAKVEHEVMA